MKEFVPRSWKPFSSGPAVQTLPHRSGARFEFRNPRKETSRSSRRRSRNREGDSRGYYHFPESPRVPRLLVDGLCDLLNVLGVSGELPQPCPPVVGEVGGLSSARVAGSGAALSLGVRVRGCVCLGRRWTSPTSPSISGRLRAHHLLGEVNARGSAVGRRSLGIVSRELKGVGRFVLFL